MLLDSLYLAEVHVEISRKKILWSWNIDVHVKCGKSFNVETH